MTKKDRDQATWPHPFGYTEMPRLPDVAPKRGRTFGRLIGRVVLRLMGFRVVGRYPDVPKLVVIGAPHTSNWDGIVAIATVLSLHLDLRLMAKKELFKGLSGRILRTIHAIPVDRDAKGGVTAQMVDHFTQNERFVLGVAPEGTRKKVEQWRTGFYRIAHGAGVPILTVALDFGRKQVRLGPTLVPTGDLTADVEVMRAFIATATGRNPENQ